MGSEPSEKEINAEIKRLRAMKPDVRRFSYFGDDHHAAIDAQLIVLNEELDEDDIYGRWDGGHNEHIRAHALEARQWLDGEAEDDMKPSQNWESLLVKKEAKRGK